MRERGRRNYRVTVHTRIGNVQRRTAQSDHLIKCQHTPHELRQYLTVKPGAQHSPLRGVFALLLQHAEFKFENRDGRKKLRLYRLRRRPRQDAWVGPLRHAQLGKNIGVEQEHQDRSASR